jgi:hypothetical protein
MSKRQLIEEIRQLNTSVEAKFLTQFEEDALKQYLEHLKSAVNRRVRIAGWVRNQPKLRMVS